jgi:addiction module HigA family antidote
LVACYLLFVNTILRILRSKLLRGWVAGCKAGAPDWEPLGLRVNKLALELHVPATRIGEIAHERRRITAETALRLGRYFKTNAEFWLNLQNFYDLECERRAGKASEIERQVQPVEAE